MRKVTILMLIAGMTLSGLNQAYGNWFTRLLGLDRTTQSEPDKGDMRRVGAH